MRLLVLSSEYPNPHSTHDTPVVHYYVQEWIRQGHDVRVVHSRSVFPKIFYPIARALKPLAKQIFKTDFIPFQRLREMERQVLDGVVVVSLPIFKLFPHLSFSQRTIRHHAQIIHGICAKSEFIPDIVVCHFLNPQLPLIDELKRIFPRAKTSLVIHEDPSTISSLFGKRTSALLDRVDHLGFRHEAMRKRFVEEIGAHPKLFLCPSGVPEQFILDVVPPGKLGVQPLTFCFVGMLIPLKNVDVLLRAFHEAFPRKDFRLRIVGEGFLRGELEALTSELGLTGCVQFEGRISREAVQDVLTDSDVFVMVSKPEAFGLSYVEAMAKGCITIGTRGQGIDGVIVSGKNGFLCEARDVSGLRDILRDITEMSVDRRLAMAMAARETAALMSDAKIARAYLATIAS